MENNIIEVAEVRDIQTITTEIKTLVRQFQSLTLAYAIEVGRRLKEAKELLPHGVFGDWLKENVSFSARQANNMMQLFEEYGDAQLTLFGAVPKSHAIADLSITKAIRLLALPENEREELLENEDVAGMSTRELEAAIKARKTAEAEAAEAKAEAQRLEELAETQAEELETRKGDRMRLVAAEERVRQLQEARDAAQKELAGARIKAQDTAAELARLKANPVVPPEKLAEMAAAAKAAAIAAEQDKRAAAEEKLKRKLEKAKEEAKAAAAKAEAAAAEKLKEAERKLQEALAAQAAAEKEAENLRKQNRLQDPDVMAFKAAFEQVQQDAEKLMRTLGRIRAKDPETAAKLGKAIDQMVGIFKTENR